MTLRESLMFFSIFTPLFLTAKPLVYAPAPVDNPLKGLVPYSSEWKKEEGSFAHSMEFRYFALGDVMTGWGTFDWTKIEETLERARKGGRQIIFRVFLEYPGKDDVLPEFLLKEGMKVTRWKDNDGKTVVTPDYESAMTRRAIRECIEAMGKKYDDDPRVAFLTAGMLGLWGEWHNYPRNDLWASKEVQLEVMRAFVKAFPKTHVLLRYPAGESDQEYADTRQAKLGYHDDSFAWATIETKKTGEEWFFMGKMRRAGLLEKWKTVPIGGEIRPEIWPTAFTDQVTGQEQDFIKCVEESHASWLMDSGMFSDKYEVNEKRKNWAEAAVRKMGYELHVSSAKVEDGELALTVENRGVAPFYYDWPVEMRAGEIGTTDWKLSEVLPGKKVVWKTKVPAKGEVAIRIPNPMKGGRALKFANKEYRDGWLVVRE